MTPTILLRATGAALVLFSLSACVDATMEVEPLSETTARGTMTMAMDRSIYDMTQAQAGGAEGEGDEAFCDEGEVELTETAAICTTTVEGDFDEISFDEEGEEGDSLRFESAGPGLVRVVFPTASLMEDVESDAGGDEEMDEETEAMMQMFFEDRSMTLRVVGRITDSNMDVSDDQMSAETEIAMLDLINGTAELPDEFYAVVEVD